MSEEREYHGLGVAPGIAIGVAYLRETGGLEVPERRLRKADVRLAEAVPRSASPRPFIRVPSILWGVHTHRFSGLEVFTASAGPKAALAHDRAVKGPTVSIIVRQSGFGVLICPAHRTNHVRPESYRLAPPPG